MLTTSCSAMVAMNVDSMNDCSGARVIFPLTMESIYILSSSIGPLHLSDEARREFRSLFHQDLGVALVGFFFL